MSTFLSRWPRAGAGASLNASQFAAWARFPALLGVVLMICVPFLNPVHFQPMPTFFEEVVAFAFGLLAIVSLVLWRAATAQIPTLTVVLGVFTLFVLGQSYVVELAYAQQSLCVVLYVVWAALLLWVGAALKNDFGLERTVDLMARAVLVGAMLSAILALVQTYVPGSEGIPFVLHSGTGRATGNTGQPNFLANLAAMGLVSIAYLHVRLRTSMLAAGFAAALLVWVLVLTGSRVGLGMLITLAALGGYLLIRSRSDAEKRIAAFALGCLVAYFAFQVLAPIFHQYLGVEASGFSLKDREVLGGGSTRIRAFLWQEAVRMFLDAPWIGVGVMNFASTLYASGAVDGTLNLAEAERYAHNMVLQLLSETGLIGASIILGGLLVWTTDFFRARSGIGSVAWWWLAGILAVQAVHNAFEYPLWHAQFLGPTAVVLGIGTVRCVRLDVGRTLRASIAALALLGAVTLGLAADSFVRVQHWMFPDPWGKAAPANELAQNYLTVAHLGGSLLGPYVELGLVASFPLDAQDLEYRHEVVDRSLRWWPTSVGAVHRAMLDVYRDDAAGARRSIDRFLLRHPKSSPQFIAAFEQQALADPDRFGPMLAYLRERANASGGSP